MNSQVKKQIVKHLATFFLAITFFTAAFQASCQTLYYTGDDKSEISNAIFKNNLDEFTNLIKGTNSNEIEKLAFCLACAIKCGNLDICDIILKKSQNNIINTEYEDQSPLCRAARWGQINVIDYLLQHGASI